MLQVGQQRSNKGASLTSCSAWWLDNWPRLGCGPIAATDHPAVVSQAEREWTKSNSARGIIMNGFIRMDGKGGERKAAELIALKTQFSSSDLPERKRERDALCGKIMVPCELHNRRTLSHTHRLLYLALRRLTAGRQAVFISQELLQPCLFLLRR